jgi:hypothetical protein
MLLVAGVKRIEHGFGFSVSTTQNLTVALHQFSGA